MPHLMMIDEPTVTTSCLVWIAKSDEDDWGALPDDSYPHKRFKPNRACVVVRQNRGSTWADWTQARFHYEDLSKYPAMEDCRGTYEFKDNTPVWARVVEDFAVDVVKGACPQNFAGRPPT